MDSSARAYREAAQVAARYVEAGWWPGEPLLDRFRRHVLDDPARCAVVDDRGVSLSRADLWSRAEGRASGLVAAGVGTGQVVVILLPNTVEWQVSFVATLMVGAVPATLPVTTDQDTLAHVYSLTDARAAVTCEKWRARPMARLAREAAAGTHVSALVIVNDGSEESEILGDHSAPTALDEGVTHLMFTSSTTGMPKAVMHTDDTLAAANVTFSERFSLDGDTSIFMPSPLGHSVGAWHGARLAMFIGAKLVLQDVWDPVRGLQLIDEHRCTFSAAATPFLKDLVDAPWDTGSPKMASLRAFLCGGAPVPPVLMKQAAEEAPQTFVSVLWGMTEGTGTTCTRESSYDHLIGTAGRAMPGLELTILDADADGIGELAMRGPQLFVGYLGQESLYRSLLTDDGFFRTGDRAWLDPEGYLHLTGRLKDLIIRGGVNISPVPIEDAIAAHPSVLRVAVIGAPDDRLGERICAVVVPKGDPPALAELNEWLTSRGLSRRNLPEVLRIIDAMPATPAGKIRKADLRRMFEEER